MKKLSSGPVLGTWLLTTDPQIVEVCGSAGMDFIVIDLEHGVWGIQETLGALRAAETCGIVAFARVSSFDDSRISRLLDIGIPGMMFADVYSVEQLSRINSLVSFPPHGNRGLSPYTRGNGFTVAEFLRRQASDDLRPMVGILLERAIAIDNLADLLASEFPPDIVYLGLYDISRSIGFAGQIRHPRVQELIDIARTRAAGSSTKMGIIVNSKEEIAEYRQKGFEFFCYQSDTGILHEAVSGVVRGAGLSETNS